LGDKETALETASGDEAAHPFVPQFDGQKQAPAPHVHNETRIGNEPAAHPFMGEATRLLHSSGNVIVNQVLNDRICHGTAEGVARVGASVITPFQLRANVFRHSEAGN
jgi:hypothetical protein